MNTSRSTSLTGRLLLCGMLAAPCYAATDLADSPLVNGSSITLLPNVLFLLDDSLSMNRDYMPDYVHLGRYCRGHETDDDDDDEEELEEWEEESMDDDQGLRRSRSQSQSQSQRQSRSRSSSHGRSSSHTLDGRGDDDGCDDDECRLSRCQFGDPPFMTSTFNKLYYNPMVNYAPPVDANGVPKTSYSGKAPLDGYGVQFTDPKRYPLRKEAYDDDDTITRYDWAWGVPLPLDLTKHFPERRWCLAGKDGDGDRKGARSGKAKDKVVDCNVYPNTMPAIVNGNYIYPNPGGDDDAKSNAKAPKTPVAHYQYLNMVRGAPYYYKVNVEWCQNRSKAGNVDHGFGASPCQARKDSTFKHVRYTTWEKVDIVPGRNSYPGPDGTTRSYSEELTNFSNWFAWYRTRLQVMKTGAGTTFKDVRGTPDKNDLTDADKLHARVGYNVTSDSSQRKLGDKYLTPKSFESTQKVEWYKRLYGTVPRIRRDDDDRRSDDDLELDEQPGTPLRSSLTKAGRIFAGKFTPDPVQYSCQRNFAFLSSDGYWSGSEDEEEGGYAPVDLNKRPVGDEDGPQKPPKPTATRPSLDKLAKRNTLADGAYYYYHTDLRPGPCPLCGDNVSPAAGGDKNVDDVASHQHMTTFTIGLGVDGTLAYQNGYANSTSGDYYDIKRGAKNWPNPKIGEDDEDGVDRRAERIDDLWHAAVNGRGTYYSALDLKLPKAGLKSAIDQANGSGASAGTSNLQPTGDDHQIYIGSYRTLKWDGDLKAHDMDPNTGVITDAPLWSAAEKLDTRIAADGNSETIPFRNIYTTIGGVRKEFRWAELGPTEKAYFDASKLSQFVNYSSADKLAATGESMVNYLRGYNRNEDQSRPVGYGAYSRLYRDREKILGDIVHSQPIFVKVPFYDFVDDGYAAFKASQSTRAGTVYVASNDGMLHAFAEESGQERWAYIPPVIMKNMYRLADNNYASNHRFFIDGPIAVSDVQISGAWRTILVGALGKGGRGYYALDITDPTSPQYLWSFTADTDARMGYSFGTAMITKVNGNWVVLLTSGYNNIPEGSNYASAEAGKGFVWALNVADGSVAKTWGTNVGDAGNPSGLAHLNVKVNDFVTDNSMLVAYGGDLSGKMYRFALDSVLGEAVLDVGDTQPITSAPEIGEIESNTVLFFGTGRYLGTDDLSNTKKQAFYAVKDKGTGNASSTSNMVLNTINGNSISTQEVKWDEKDGWYMTLPLEKERVHLSPQLYFNTLLFASIIPTATECEPGGHGRLYLLNYDDGSAAVPGAPFISSTSPIGGFTVMKTLGGSARIQIGHFNGDISTEDLPVPKATGALSGQRIMWRELAN